MRVYQRLKVLEAHPGYQAAVAVIEQFYRAGHECLFVGGCVRDAIMGIVPGDLDMATSATPDEMEKIFSSTHPLGREFGTLILNHQGYSFEVTTFRQDGKYEDGRHPVRVEFSNRQADASRRDFTINALFYLPQESSIFDDFGGVEDIHKRLIRSVGRAEDRYLEDHLRMLRAFRFQSQTGFAIDPQDLAAIRTLHERIQKISTERIWRELKKLLAGDSVVTALEGMQKSSLSQDVIPYLENVELRNLRVALPTGTWETALCLLIILSGERRARGLKTRYKMSATEHHKLRSLETLAMDIGSGGIADQLERLATVGRLESAVVVLSRMADLKLVSSEFVNRLLSRYRQIMGADGKLPKAFLQGDDLLNMGVPKGPFMGKVLKEAFHRQLEGSLANREQALLWAKSKLNSPN